VTVTWTQLSGPGSVSFADNHSLSTPATFSTAGTYTLRLTASDTVLTSSDDVVITVNPPAVTNRAPVVNAGLDQTITLPAVGALAATATDDGLPSGVLTAAWSLVSGPGVVTFGDPTAFTGTVSFSAAGTYTLRLTASDGALSSSDDVVFTVNAATAVNQAPVVSAGSDQTITLPASATLSGTATDDGLPAGITFTVTWC